MTAAAHVAPATGGGLSPRARSGHLHMLPQPPFTQGWGFENTQPHLLERVQREKASSCECPRELAPWSLQHELLNYSDLGILESDPLDRPHPSRGPKNRSHRPLHQSPPSGLFGNLAFLVQRVPVDWQTPPTLPRAARSPGRAPLPAVHARRRGRPDRRGPARTLRPRAS